MGHSMFKRFFLAFALIAGLFSPALGAGSISLSLSQQFDTLGRPLNGGKIYFIQAGTTSTPQNAYQDSALTIPHPNPLTLDSAGRVPQLFFADGNIKVRITNSAGVQQLVADNVLVVGASSGGGGGGTVDATTILATGDIKVRYGTGTLTGFVRFNGRTIGSATSGASERANADTQALFEHLWDADSNLTVSTGRGATAAADWTANKTIALPDMRGKVMAGLDDMGAAAASAFTGVTFTSGAATTLGSILGSATKTIAQNYLPNATLAYSNAISVTSASTYFQTNVAPVGIVAGSGGSNYIAVPNGAVTTASSVASTGTSAGTTASINGGVVQVAMPTIQSTILITVYAKL